MCEGGALHLLIGSREDRTFLSSGLEKIFIPSDRVDRIFDERQECLL